MTAPRTWLSWAAPCLGALTLACGATTPSDSTIFHDAALRPGVSDSADPDEEGLLAQIADAPAGTVSVGASTFELGAAYSSASGRACRAVTRAQRDRLACAFDDGWRYVPAIERAAPPSRSSGAEPDAE